MAYKVYLVGGAVRDQLLGLPVKERDWVVVGAMPEDLLKQGYQQVGKNFPVFLHPKTKDEYALARIERKDGHGYQGFSCQFSNQVTLEEDLIRRDLTINAMAMDDKQQIIDPYGGLNDLKHKILRHVSNAFVEDPLRVLRVARFAARLYHLGFSIAPETMHLMQSIVKSGELRYLSVERIWKEFELGFASPHPVIFIQSLKDCNALHYIAPMLEDLALADLQRISPITHNTTSRLVIYLSQLDAQALAIFSQDFKLPKHLVHLIKHFILAKDDLLFPKDANTCLKTLERLDAFRQKQLFFELVETVTIWGGSDNTSKIKSFWEKVIAETLKIKLPQSIQETKDPHQIHDYFKHARLECIKIELDLVRF